MKNIFLSTTLLTAISVTPQLANAALIDGSVLDFDGVFLSGNVTALPAVGNGSWFSMQLEPVPALPAITSISSFNGLVIGTTQNASSIPAIPNIDNPWFFAGNPGAHQSTSDTSIISASGDTATIDFSGWGFSWNGIAFDLSAGSSNGIATITCDTGSGCGNGSDYVLDYFATVPPLPASKVGAIKYRLHLEGTISAVPVPGAVWLFGSGLIGLIGMARRKR